MLGNLDASRDWGYAGDYVRAMWLMLQQDEPEDYVIGMGTEHTVRDFVDAAFARVGLDPAEYVEIDPALIRPAEVDRLVADPSKASDELGWTPEVDFQGLVEMMVDAALVETAVGIPGTPPAREIAPVPSDTKRDEQHHAITV
jgi:GDPmannose 4,6-dehydratase